MAATMIAEPQTHPEQKNELHHQPVWLSNLQEGEYFAALAFAAMLPISLTFSEGLLYFGLLLFLLRWLAAKFFRVDKVLLQRAEGASAAGAGLTSVAVGSDPVVATADPVSLRTDSVVCGADPVLGSADPVGIGVDPGAVGPDPVAVGPDPVAVGPDPVAVGPDPVAVGPDPVAVEDPIAGGADPVSLAAAPVAVEATPVVVGASSVVGATPVILCAGPFIGGADPVTSGAASAAVAENPALTKANQLTAENATQACRAPLAVPLFLMALAIAISGALNAGGQAGQLTSHSLHSAWRSVYDLKSMLAYFWAFYVFRKSKNCAVSSIVLLLCSSAIAGVWGSIQQIMNIHPGLQWLQGTGFHGHPMAFAGQMEIFSLLALGVLLSSGYKSLANYALHPLLKPLLTALQNNLVFILITALNFAGLFFAAERSAWLGGFAGVIAVTALKSWRLALKAMLGLCAAAAAALILFAKLRERIEVALSGHDASFAAREIIWHDCLHNYFPKSPIFGIGWMNFPHIDMPSMTNLGAKGLHHAHSNYVHILTTTGILGLLLHFNLLIFTFKAAITKFRSAISANDELSTGIAMGLFGAGVSLAIAGIFEFNFGTAQVRLAQWFLFGLL
jgi:O-antigen ligase